MKYLVSLAFIVISSLNIYAQKFELFTDFNLGTLSHQPLKTFHKGLAEQIPYNNIETTDNFGINYGFTVGFKVNSINTSFFYQNKVSGAKSSTADFSGFIRLTTELKGSTLGGIYELKLQEFKRGALSIGVKGLITSSKLIVESDTKISNSAENSVLNFKSLDFGTGAILIYKYPIKAITFRAIASADFYLGGKLKFKDMNDAHLLDDKGNKVTTGWSGLNLGIGISIPLVR